MLNSVLSYISIQPPDHKTSLYLFWIITYYIVIYIVYTNSFICLLENEINYTTWAPIKIVLECLDRTPLEKDLRGRAAEQRLHYVII